MHKPEVPGGGLRKLLLIGICHLGTGLMVLPKSIRKVLVCWINLTLILKIKTAELQTKNLSSQLVGAKIPRRSIPCVVLFL